MTASQSLGEGKTPYSLPGTTEFMLAARNGQNYRLMIAEPLLPPPAGGYPVIYALDGNATFATLADAVRLQTRSPHGFDPAIVVAIGAEGDKPFDNAGRVRDFTTPAEISRLPVPPSGEESWDNHGSADAFARVIDEDIKPLIAARYPVDAGRLTLFGHSLGGFFTLHCAFSRPESFSAFFAGSPSIWWGGQELLGRTGAFQERLAGLEKKPRLAIGFGGGEVDGMLADGRALAKQLEAMAGLDFTYREFEGEEHISVLPAILGRLPAFALGGGKHPLRSTGLKINTAAR